ncbi:MAG: saccharopine dehydrogenase family protein, partial [Candidatus Hodarchaeales archaeon]
VIGFDKDQLQREKQKNKLNNFKNRFHVKPLDLNQENRQSLEQILRENEISVVFGAIDYRFNYLLSQICIAAECSFVDLGGNPLVVKQQQGLNEKATNAGVTIIPDLGLAPGMVNIIAAHGMSKFDTLDECHLRVGGLPQQPKTILNYQQVFAIRGLTNEYLEDARIIENGKLKIVPSLTEIEKIIFPEPWGELEAFTTAGGTSSLPDLYENNIQQLTYKTIRFPGHAQFFVFLKEFGLLSGEKFPVNPVISPREVVEYYLVKTLPQNQPDVVLARITIVGNTNNRKTKHIYQLIDLYNSETNSSAMARTTAYPTSIIGQFIAHGKINTPGVLKAEESVPAKALILELQKRNIEFDFEEIQE